MLPLLVRRPQKRRLSELVLIFKSNLLQKVRRTKRPDIRFAQMEALKVRLFAR